MTLWGDDDFNYHTRKVFESQNFALKLESVRWDGRWTRKKVRPVSSKKDFHSDALNCTIHNLKAASLGSKGELHEVTASALYNMDDAGGYDNYILRTPPQAPEA